MTAKAEEYSLAVAASTVRSWHVAVSGEGRLSGNEFSTSDDGSWPHCARSLANHQVSGLHLQVAVDHFAAPHSLSAPNQTLDIQSGWLIFSSCNYQEYGV